VRRYRDVRLTEAGRLLLERARVLLRDADLALHVSRQAMAGEAGVLRIGFGVASLAKLLPEVLLRFRRSHPRVEIQMRDMSSPAQLLAIRREEIDVGFVRAPVRDPEVEAVPILRERLVAAVGPRVVYRDRVGLACLRDHPFVACSRAISASYYDHVTAVCRAAGFTPRIVQETAELFTLLHLVRAGLGAALVPSSAASMRVPGVRLRDTGLHEAAWDVALAWRRGSARGPLVTAFTRVARDAYADRPARTRAASGRQGAR
jgi:DNA-binding transcriptional LysR family regulator